MKINWKIFLIIFSICVYIFGKYLIKNIDEFIKLKKLYTEINAKSSIPTKNESVEINKIKDSVISDVRKSNLFKKYGKESIIDSIKNIDFKILDTLDTSGPKQSDGCYINISYIKSYKKNYFLNPPIKNNFIFITRYEINQDDIKQVVTHEIYHYLDKMLGDSINNFSDNIKINRFIDTKIDDSIYCIKKIDYMLGINKTDKFAIYVFREINPMMGYYSNNHEVFVRYKQLKVDMVKYGIINNINQKIDIMKIPEFFKKTGYNIGNYSLVLCLNLDKLEELDKIIL